MTGGRLTVCLVAPAMPPTIGGAETLAELLTLTLAGAGVAVRVLTAEAPRPGVAEAVRAAGGDVEVLGSTFGPVDGSVGWEWATFARAEAIHRVCSTGRVDIVHALSHDAIVSACIALAGPGAPACPLVATTSEMSTEDTRFGAARSAFVYGLPIDGLLQLSQYYSDVADRHGCRPRARRVAAAVDVDLFSSGSAERGRRLLGVDLDALLVMCPGRFSLRKGQLDLLAALDLLPAGLRGRVACVLAGSTSSASADHRRRVLDAAGRSGVRCAVTAVARADMPDALAASDLVVMPSHLEGLGFAAIEAMVAGTPVLLADVHGLREIPGAPGQVAFVPAGQPPALAAALADLLSDPDRRRRLAAAGRERALDAFAPRRLAEAAISLYRELLDRPAAHDVAG